MPSKERYAITGASGLVGSALAEALRGDGAEVVPLVRDRARAVDGAVYWSPAKGEIDSAGLEGLTGVVHLAGENVAGGRWTEARKARILNSRVDGTRLLADAVGKLEAKPRVFVSASAIGLYGSRGDEALDESASPGEGFLAEVCRQWEAAAAPIAEQGVRLVIARIGIVLAKEGGALDKMKLPFSLGLGGRIGDGRQYMSCISLHDLVRALQYVLREESVSGPVNVVAPGASTNAEFTKALGRAMGRPTFLPVPKFALRIGAGEMADEMLLAGSRVVPAALQRHGFQWTHPDVESALAAALG